MRTQHLFLDLRSLIEQTLGLLIFGLRVKMWVVENNSHELLVDALPRCFNPHVILDRRRLAWACSRHSMYDVMKQHNKQHAYFRGSFGILT